MIYHVIFFFKQKLRQRTVFDILKDLEGFLTLGPGIPLRALVRFQEAPEIG